MATCNNTTLIYDSECIGESLLKINTNFSNLDSGLCQLGKDVVSLENLVRNLNVNDTSTIDLTFNGTTYSLLGDVKDGSLGTIKLGGDIPTTTKQFLTGARLTSLIDTSIAGVVINDVLSWNGTRWINRSLVDQVGAKQLNDLDDVTVSAPQNKQVLVYNSSTNQWINSTPETPNVSVLNGDYGDITVSNIGQTWTIDAGAVGEIKLANGAVTNAKLGGAPALSIKGNPTNALFATPTDIQATTDNRVLVRSGNTLQFGIVPNEATTATNLVLPSTIVARDVNSDFSANIITATQFRGNLNGTADAATTAGFANTAGFATNATNANLAALANLATRALSADYATVAGYALSGSAIVSVLSASQADLATRALSADRAVLADLATRALSADLATRALSADIATRALSADRAVAADFATTITTNLLIPVGAVIPIAIPTAPAGWLICNGDIIGTLGTVQGVDIALLQVLRNLLGTTYGTFGQLPDLRGYFIRGSGTNIDGTVSGTFGTKQADAFQAHEHAYSQWQQAEKRFVENMKPGIRLVRQSETTSAIATKPGYSEPRFADETRPKNIALLYCIKY